MRAATLFALLSTLAAARPARAEPAAPVIRIRARARLTVGTVERIAGGVAVAGDLWDDAAGAPVAGKRVRVALREPQTGALLEGEAASDGRGAFRVELPAPLGSYQVQADFDGDGDYPEPRTATRTVDVARRPVELVLSAPERAGVGAGGLPVNVMALVDGKPAELTLRVAIDVRPAVVLRSDENGRADALLELPADAGPSARLVVRARFDGDDVRDAAVAERAVLVTTPTTIAAALDAPTVHRGEETRVAGRLDDARGPLAGQVVLAMATDGRTLGQATTDEGGRFAIAVATRGLSVGGTRLAVAYDPPVSYRDGTRSPALELTVLPPVPVPLGGYLVPPFATALVLFLAWTWRKHPWRRWRRARVAPADESSPARELRSSGLVEARPRITATFRRAQDLGVDGVVWDAPFDRPVAAQVRVVAGAVGHTVACDRRGRFSVENLPAGRCLFTIFAPGYLPVRFERELPHRGELRGVRVNLMPLRAEILALYKQVTLGFLPELRFVELWTPRELCDHVRKTGAIPDALGALALLLEESYYSPRLPGEDALAEAVRLAALLDAPLRRAAPPRLTP